MRVNRVTRSSIVIFLMVPASALHAQDDGPKPPSTVIAPPPIDPRLPKKFRGELAVDKDGRVLNHLAYQPDARARKLKLAAPSAIYIATESWDGKGKQKDCLLQKEAAGALNLLLADADKQYPEDHLLLRAFSCYRGVTHQRDPFCHLSANKNGTCEQPRLRAFKSAPPRFSEHATGYTLDFVVRPADDVGRSRMIGLKWCDKGDTDPCPQIADTRIGKWLQENAAKYGFEMSFPPASGATDGKTAQGISFEPWHFRWVGKNDATDAAKDARKVFLRARMCYPADKAVDDPPAKQAAAAVTCPGPNQPIG